MIRHKIYQQLVNHLNKKQFTILTGARQIGKSTVMRQLEQYLIKTNKPVYFLNLEYKEILQDLNANPENIFKYCGHTDEKVYVIIDEIQYLDDPSNFLKLLYDEHHQKLKLIVTGSSAFYMDTKFKDSLSGRKQIFQLYTLDFLEFLQFKSQNTIIKDLEKMANGTIQKSIHEQKIWTLLEEYIIYGGYPAVVLANSFEEKIQLLQELKNSFLQKDMQDSGVKFDDKFYQLFKILADQASGMVNSNELSITLRINHATIENYLYILQKCFHIHLLKPYFNNLRKELSKMPKVFLNDTGMRNAMLNNFESFDTRVDKGFLFENFIYTLLRNKMDLEQINFWRTADQNEVDFIIAEKSMAFEVKFSETDNKETKYKKFKSLYPEIKFEFVNWRQTKLRTWIVQDMVG